ncbi:MAG: NAD-binding protein [Candidatus Aenigmarchaeota archaeon]|nr:NAD-binding protein [Candidatus Aenigmarchaeota archaeon]
MVSAYAVGFSIFEEMKMYVIVCGGGRMISNLVTDLAAEKHDVVIVEKNHDVAENLAETLNATVIEGNATDPKIMHEAGLEKADMVVAITPNESDNLLICLNAKKMRSCKTAARVERVESEETFRGLGIDTVIHPERAAAHYLEEMITKPEVVDLAFIGRGEAAILEFDITKKSLVNGKKVKDIEYPKGSVIVAIHRNGKLIIPEPSTEIKPGEKILVLANNSVIERVRKMFR